MSYDVDLESIRVDCAASTLTALGMKEAEMRLIGIDFACEPAIDCDVGLRQRRSDRDDAKARRGGRPGILRLHSAGRLSSGSKATARCAGFCG